MQKLALNVNVASHKCIETESFDFACYQVGNKIKTIWGGENSLSPFALLHCNLKAGDLHFCKKRGKTKCCFENEKCEGNWDTINDKVRKNCMQT